MFLYIHVHWRIEREFVWFATLLSLLVGQFHQNKVILAIQHPPFLNQILFMNRHVFLKQRCLSGNKVKIWQKSPSPTFWSRPIQPACDISEKWRTRIWTYSTSLVTVSPQNFKYCTLFVSGTEFRTDKRTNDSITKWPRRTFNAGGIKIWNTLTQIFTQLCQMYSMLH